MAALFSISLSTVVLALALCSVFLIQTVSAQSSSTDTATISENSSTVTATISVDNDTTVETITDTETSSNSTLSVTSTTMASTTKAPELQYNQTCNTTVQCQIGLICTDNKCGCSDTEYYDLSSTSCKTKIQHNQTCNTTMPCQTGLICNNTKCVCKDTEYYDPSLTSCKTKISYDQPCSSTMPCQADLICKTSNNKCGCLDTEYYDSTSSTDMCKTKISHDQPCSSTMPCQADLICKTSNKCGCLDTEYYDSTSSTDMCKPKISYDQPCSSTMPCQADLICKTSNKCEISYDQPCSSTMLCQADLICKPSNNKCGCMDTEYYDSTSSTDMCKTKINYNESCDGINSPNACSERFTICTEYTGGTKKCLCDNTYYRTDNSSCSSQDKLKVQFTAKTRSTQFIFFTWNDTSGRNNINNTIMWSGNSSLATKTGGNVTGLTPGTPYNFSVVSTLPSDSNYGLITVFSMPNLQWTYPAKPGSVIGQNLSSDSTSKPFSYNVSFGKPDGNVVRCKVTITDTENITAPGCRETTASFTVNCQLEPARQYNYTIICYNGNSDPDQSEPTTGSFFTQPEGSGPVRNLNYTGVLENSANITWHKPSDPNGNIIGYLVEVKQQENDECVYSIKVSCQQQILDTVNSSCRDTDTESVVCGEEYIFAVSRLSPYHNYTIVVKAVNQRGLGIPKNISLRTDIGAANCIKTLSPNSARDENSHQVNLNISWQPGEYTGPTTYYILVEKETGLGTNMYNESSQHSVTDYYRTTFGLSDVLAYWNYKISVTAGTSKGNSSRMEAQFRTAANRPGFVQNLKVLQDAAVAKKLSLTFFCPEEQNRNGTIESFVINQTLLDSSNGTIYKVSNQDSSCKIMYSVPVTEISVEKNYSFSVKTINSYSEGEFGKSVSVFIYSKAPPAVLIQASCKIPQLEVTMNNLGVDKLIKKVNDNEETKITVDVCSKCLLDDRQGTVTNVGILVCIKGLSCPENSGRTRRAVFTNEDYNKFPTWGSAKIKDFKEKYRTTPNDWKHTLKGDSVYSTYIIGGNTSCSDTSVASEYCNGPLPSGNTFTITIVVCTEAGCAVHDDEFVTSSTTAEPVGAIVGGVLGGLALIAVICLIVFLLIHLRRRRDKPTRRSVLREMDDRIQQQRPVKIRDFNEHVLKFHKDSNLLFQDEFENIQNLSKTFKSSCNEAQRESNRVKNRYVDILPYSSNEAQRDENRVKNRYVDIIPFDHSRVKLDILPDDDETNDFINANYIRGYNSVREYIATQGPMFCTIPDFWRMAWEQKCKLIVMLSDLMEGGKRKVDLYWPENLNEPINYGTVVVEMTNFSQLNHYIIRNFKVTKGEETRKITHFFLPGWSDFSADVGFDVILGFVKVVRQEATPANPGPIIVHCSAGVGRTGTLIAIDYFTQFVEKHSLDDEIDVFDFVIQMRKNRTRMVQVESQYIFIYDAINKIIQKKIKAEEEKMYENSSNGVYANMGQPEESIYENTTMKADKYVYNNDAFEPDISNIDSSEKSDKPTTEL